mgnify:CR=1 FL=1
MILYEFSCTSCGKEFEEMVSSREEMPACPSCGSTQVKRLLSAVSCGSSSGESEALGSACAPGGFS